MITDDLVALVRKIYTPGNQGESCIPLHRPVFCGSEKNDLAACIDSNVVSSVGAGVTSFEKSVAGFSDAKFGVAVVNGTNALQVALRLVGVERDTEVITQALTFVATCNAIAYLQAQPVFVDVERSTLGMNPEALQAYLEKFAEQRENGCYNKSTGRRIAACQPMHTFGHPCRIDQIAAVCQEWGIPLVEDAAESLGSYYKGQHTGSFGRLGVFSFNGNKIITTGGGGMIVTNDEPLAQRARHLTTTAKVKHTYEYDHDELAYNFRMPNLNATLGCAQMVQLSDFILAKRDVAVQYEAFCCERGIDFVKEPTYARSNYWLNAVLLQSEAERNEFLKLTNEQGVMTRPIWKLMVDLPMYSHCHHDGLPVSRFLECRVVCLPSSVPDSYVRGKGSPIT